MERCFHLHLPSPIVVTFLLFFILQFKVDESMRFGVYLRRTFESLSSVYHSSSLVPLYCVPFLQNLLWNPAARSVASLAVGFDQRVKDMPVVLNLLFLAALKHGSVPIAFDALLTWFLENNTRIFHSHPGRGHQTSYDILFHY